MGNDTHQPAVRDYIKWTLTHLKWLDVHKSVVASGYMVTRDCYIQITGEEDGMLGW